MISIDDHPPSDPSSSHHHRHQQQQISHDFNFSDIDLKSTDAHLPNFSIRDYVFGLRSKDVACNWPFSPTSLQLCLKHGVKNLLPPFESLDLLRDNSSVNRLHDEEIVIGFNGKPTNDDQVKSNGVQASGSVTVSLNSSDYSKRDNESQFQFQKLSTRTKSKEKEKPPNYTENIKKGKLVIKLNSGVEQVEEIAMNSKICPVCKIFSSSSNTTLNAHIDQCLTGEGTMKWTDNSKVIVKHRVKPRKTRLMMEIYKTAPHCTIEELDRRNGTSWATNSNFPAQQFQFQEEEEEEEEKQEEEEEEEKQETRTTTINRDVADNEGDVYIDTDGTKVRILSVPKSGSLDNNHGRKLIKGIKGSKFVIGKKKFKGNLHNKQKHHKKYLKVSPNSKKLCSQTPKARNCEEEESAAIAENCRKVERLKKPVNDRLADLAIVRPPWACSKRTNLSKKFTGKRKHRKNLRIESDKSSSRCDLGSPPLSSDDVALSQIRKKIRTSSPLMVDFRKESTRMHDDDDHEGSSTPSRNSDSDDTKSKGRKFLRKNLSFPIAKLNLKRKSFSFNGTFQNSSKENSRNEEETRSGPSKSTSNEESSVGVEPVDVDVNDDVQSVRNETISNHEQVSVIPPPNFTGLSNSFGPEFSKCVELYQEQLLSCSTNRAPDVEKHDLFFHEDDPIPIPGPPGSFLPPSPGGDMVSDEQLQANSSSTTTTRVPSSDQNHLHDTMDRDSMSNSPVSTVSNPSQLARSDSRSTSVVQDDIIKPGISGYMVDGTKSFPISFKNDQPCCCSRKDGAFSYTQESSIIRRQLPIESNKNIPSGFNFRSDTFPLSNYSISQPPENTATAIFPTMKKLPVNYHDNNDSVASPSNKPVLRLMGKNLTVVEPGENNVSPSPSSSQPFRPPQTSQLSHQPPVIFTQFQNGSESQRFNVYPPVNMRSHGGFMAPMDRYDHGRSHHGHNSNEIIIIDDLVENELDDSMRKEILRRNHGQMNPLYTMYNAQSNGHVYSGGGGGSTVFRGGSFNGDLGKWSVGSSSSMSPSRSTSHMRSSTSYYPSSYP